MKIQTFNSRKKKTKTVYATRKIVLSFFIVILIGSVILTLPQCNKTITSYINHLFVATSAVCVTGLVPVTTANQYTLLGQIVIIILIQIGGLGFLTFYSMMVSLLQNKLSYVNRMIMTEALNQNSMNSIKKYIQRVVKYTFFFEGIGAILLAFQFVPEYGPKGIYYSIFHAISGFCNAGFDVLGSNSLCNYDTNLLVNLTISGLIIAGGLGFIVWIDLKHCITRYKEEYKVFDLKVFFNSFQLQTKITLFMTVFLLVLGTFTTFAFEYNKVLASYNLFDKVLVSFFTSTTLRTAGFATVDFALFSRTSKLIMCVFMLIGGSPTGCAGGIKTVTFAISSLYVLRLFKGKEKVTVYKRQISNEIIEKSLTIFMVGLTVSIIGIICLSATEKLPLIDLIFEVFSAFGTVGLTASVTPSLSVIGKVIVMLLMFMGRVGPLSIFMIMSQTNHQEGKEVAYPKGNVIIG